MGIPRTATQRYGICRWQGHRYRKPGQEPMKHEGGLPNYMICRHIPAQGFRNIVVLRKQPKDKDLIDAAHQIGRALASVSPIAPGPLQVLFENLLGPSLEKRRWAWAEELADAIKELQAEMEDLTPEKLAANEVFVTVT